ncbi:MAG: alpha/beta hydrolase [Siphonobacter sp.]
MKRLRLLIIPLGLIIVLYLFPVPEKDAAQLYDAADREPINGLVSFRQIPTRTITTQGYDWTYQLLGTGPKAILFLHGMSGGYDFWWQQMKAFSPEYRVISVTYPPIDHLKGLAMGIMEILDKEKIDKTVVVGSSLGGYLTQYILTNYPQRVTKAVFGNTFPRNNVLKQETEGKMKIVTWSPEWIVMNSLRQNLYDKIFPAAENNPLAKAMLLENTYGRMTKAQFLARYHCVIDDFKPIDGKQTSIPTMILESDNDPLVPPVLRQQLKKHYSSARVYTFHNKGHFPYINAAGEYNQVLKSFL